MTWTRIKKKNKQKVNALKRFALREQCPDTTFAFVTEMDGDTSGVSSRPESSVFVQTNKSFRVITMSGEAFRLIADNK